MEKIFSLEKQEDFKKRIINKVKCENLIFNELFQLSLDQTYQYCFKIKFNTINGIKQYVGGISINAPRFTDFSPLEETYHIAHELGHHNINKHLYVLSLYLYKKSAILTYIVEALAWGEAKKICIAEEIPISDKFFEVKNKCLSTYSMKIKHRLKYIINFLIKIMLSYYGILAIVYEVYRLNSDNINDSFGVLKCLESINKSIIPSYAISLWIAYWILIIFYHVIKNVRRCYKVINKKA